MDALAAKPEPVYGVSTGFGALAIRHISPELRAQLQRNIVRSHAAGMGPRVEREVVRALMFLRLKTLASGRTGVRPEVAQTMADVLNAGITPVVHEYGSLGCSGDLAPLSHCALTLMGEGDAEGPDGVVRPAGELLAAHGIAPVELREKEGLALLNGTDGMLGMLVHGLRRPRPPLHLRRHHRRALPGGAARHRQGARARAARHPPAPGPGRLRRQHADGAGRFGTHRATTRTTRPASRTPTRCAAPRRSRAPAGTPSRTPALVAERELAAAVDNPVVLPDGRVESNGNFHGAPVAYVLDFLAIAAADLGSIAERRTDRLLDKNRSHGLPPFLARRRRRRLGADDRAVHAGRAGQRDEAAGGAGLGRLDPVLRDAGGPRLDGLVRRAQAAHGRGQPHPDRRRRAVRGDPRHRTPRRADGRRRRPPRSAVIARAARGRRPGPRPGPLPRARPGGGRGVRTGRAAGRARRSR